MHFAVDPIVRRASRNSLLISLLQTAEAMRGNSQAADSSIAVTPTKGTGFLCSQFQDTLFLEFVAVVPRHYKTPPQERHSYSPWIGHITES